MTTDYYDELVEAQQRTTRFNLACPRIHESTERLLTPSKQALFSDIVRDAVGELSLKEVVAQCLSIHLRLQQPLEKFFDVPIIFTIGYVYTPPNYLFKQTETELFKLLHEGMVGSQVNLHAWLTLPSMEIIDISLASSIAAINQNKELLGSVIASHADELEHGLRYHPMILGADYLEKIGALKMIYYVA